MNNSLLDTSQQPAYLLSMIQRWLALVLGIVVAVLALFVVTLSTQLRTNAGFTGASLVSLMSFSKTLANLVQMYTLLETSIGAVGRLKSFSDDTPRESRPEEDVVPATSWPEKGRIEIHGVSASYRQVDRQLWLHGSLCPACILTFSKREASVVERGHECWACAPRDHIEH